ncbi:pentatricopeptide repeat-containing protein At1g31790 [Typha angustifolia]|uniref:pentatricopeptide repeat-containing protein At1g31790 n=1 Tax=Typha angustifolia TaxID=59011 RepID=UPI003C2AF003
MATAATTTHTPTRWRHPRRRPEPSVQSLPVLLRRPQLPSSSSKDTHVHLIIPTTTTTSTPNLRRRDYFDEEEEEEEEQNNNPSDVLLLMDALRVPVDEELYISLIKECTQSEDAAEGVKIHAHIAESRRSLPGLLLANRLLLMYAACGASQDARKLFDEMPDRDEISWATVIAACSACCGEAMQLFVEMRAELDGVLNLDTTIAILQSCARARELRSGEQLHGLLVKAFGMDAAVSGDVGSSLMQFYGMVGRQDMAQQLFDRMSLSSQNAWTCMITGYCREGRFDEAIVVFREMARSGKRSCFAVSSILMACAGVGDGGQTGRQVHADAVKLGMDSNQFVGSSLVHMYSKYGLSMEARRSFELIRELRDTVCWNALLTGYTRSGCLEEAVDVLYEMKATGIHPPESMIDEVKMACAV